MNITKLLWLGRQDVSPYQFFTQIHLRNGIHKKSLHNLNAEYGTKNHNRNINCWHFIFKRQPKYKKGSAKWQARKENHIEANYFSMLV